MARTLTEASRRLKQPGILLTDDVRLPDPTPYLTRLVRGSLLILRRREARSRKALSVSLKPKARALGLKLLIAADQSAAMAARVEGVHVPEFQTNLMSLARLRLWRRANPSRLISTSAHSPRAIHAAQSWADLVFISPVFETESHRHRTGLGALTYRLWTRDITHGVVPLGGITAQTFRQLNGAKLAGIAAIGGWVD